LGRIYFEEIDNREKKKKKILKSLGLHGQGEITGRKKKKKKLRDRDGIE
jgi:hypothetical protein